MLLMIMLAVLGCVLWRRRSSSGKGIYFLLIFAVAISNESAICVAQFLSSFLLSFVHSIIQSFIPSFIHSLLLHLPHPFSPEHLTFFSFFYPSFLPSFLPSLIHSYNIFYIPVIVNSVIIIFGIDWLDGKVWFHIAFSRSITSINAHFLMSCPIIDEDKTAKLFS